MVESKLSYYAVFTENPGGLSRQFCANPHRRFEFSKRSWQREPNSKNYSFREGDVPI
jgi:hypothetical protein